VNADEPLTPKQFKAIDAILSAGTREEAATRAGVSERTLRRWLNTDTFRSELRRQRTRMLDATASILTVGSAACARALVAIATAGGGPRDNVRVSAARAVLDLAAKAEELSTLSARLDALEAAVAATARTRGGLQ